MKSTIIVTGCDARFYPYMQECLASLLALNIDQKADIAILDLGLHATQINELRSKGFIIKAPTWPDFVPKDIRTPHQIGLVARTALREYFPGYSVYLWFDADAWAQTPEFFDVLINGAREKGAAVVREDGTNYKRGFMYNKWWLGHMLACYGPVTGLSISLKPAINIGILALSDTAPHWDSWIKNYQKFIGKRNRLNNQHSFNAAIDLDHLPYAKAPARCNWITNLSIPSWNTDLKMLCEPNSKAMPLSVVHLAGPNKNSIYQIKETKGGRILTPLTYKAIQYLRNPSLFDLSGDNTVMPLEKDPENNRSCVR